MRHTIGANVRNRRLTLGWSQQELADRFGVSRATVSQYEIGTGEINAGDLPRLAGILGLELTNFFNVPAPVSAPPVISTSKDTLQTVFFPGDIQSQVGNGERFADGTMRTVLSPALPSPALGDPNDAARKTIISIDNDEGTRYITKADNRVYIIDDNGKTAKAMGHFASDAKIPVVTELLGSTLILSAEDHEALRRMVDKMQGTVSPDADQTRRD